MIYFSAGYFWTKNSVLLGVKFYEKRKGVHAPVWIPSSVITPLWLWWGHGSNEIFSTRQ